MARRPSRSTSKVDVGDLLDFQTKLALAASTVDEMGEDWEQEWGQEWVDLIKANVPDTGPGDPVHLVDQIKQVEPGGISMGEAYWWWFLEDGTSHMPPQPIVKPAMKKMRTPARKDAFEKAIELIQRGKVRAG